MTGPLTAWEPLLDRFAAYAVAVLGLAPATIRKHGVYLRTFGRWWDAAHGPADPALATTAELADFLVAEAERGMSPRTRRTQIAALRRFYDWLVLTGHAATNPATALSTPRAPAQVVHVYRPDEVIAILGHTGGLTDLRGRQRHAIVSTLRFTGMRSAELRGLRIDDIELDAARARVLGKGARSRVVLLPPALIATLEAFLREVRPCLPASPLLLANPHPFVTTPRTGFGQEALAREVELAALGAGIPGRHFPHKWRHTFATELVRAGVDIHVVQRLLGHSSIASTTLYTHLSLDDLQDTLASVWPTQ